MGFQRASDADKIDEIPRTHDIERRAFSLHSRIRVSYHDARAEILDYEVIYSATFNDRPLEQNKQA